MSINKEINDLITSVGSETFIKYYQQYQNQAEKKVKSNKEILLAFKEEREIWASSSTATKASAGKMIFVKGYEQEVLYKIINDSKKLSSDLIEKAKHYLNLSSINIIDNIETYPTDNETERCGLVKLRIQQSLFRQMVINHWEACAVTNCKISTILIASHIKSWKESDSFEKLDPFNGILLSPTYDRLFDKYLISFEDDGMIMISNKISPEDLNSLNVKTTDRLNLQKLEDSHRKYLVAHRQKFLDIA